MRLGSADSGGTVNGGASIFLGGGASPHGVEVVGCQSKAFRPLDGTGRGSHGVDLSINSGDIGCTTENTNLSTIFVRVVSGVTRGGGANSSVGSTRCQVSSELVNFVVEAFEDEVDANRSVFLCVSGEGNHDGQQKRLGKVLHFTFFIIKLVLLIVFRI